MTIILTVAIVSTAFVGLAMGLAPTFSAATVIQGPQSTEKYNIAYHVESKYDAYLASWRGDGKGDNVVITSRWEEAGLANIYPSWYWYEISVGGERQDGRPGTINYEAHCANEAEPVKVSGLIVAQKFGVFEACSFKLLGDKTGVLRVVLHVRACFLIETPDCGSPFTAASDEALVESGATMLQVADQRSVYQEGDVVKIQLRTGGCGIRASETERKDGCYALSVHQSNGDTLCASKITGDRYALRMQECGVTVPVPNRAGTSMFGGYTGWKTYEFVIPKGAFNPQDPHDNEWRIELLNEVVSARSVVIFTVDNLNKIPKPPTIKLEPQPLISGTRSTLTIMAEANPNGTIDLLRARVYAWYGTSSSMPGLGDDPRWVPNFNGRNVTLTRTEDSDVGTHRFTASVDIIPPKEGEIQVRVVVIDTERRASEPANLKVATVGAEVVPEDLPSSTGHRAFVAVVIVIAALAIVAGFVFIRNPTHKWALVASVAVAGSALIAWTFWTAGGGGFQ